MKKTLLTLAVLSACSSMTVAASAAVTSGSILTDKVISEDVVINADKTLKFTDGSSALFGVWTFDKKVQLTGKNVEVNANAKGKNAYALAATTGGTLDIGQPGRHRDGQRQE